MADLQRTVYPHSGHLLAAGQAQNSESSPAKDRRSPTVLRYQRCCEQRRNGNDTGVAGDGDIFHVPTVMTAPAAVTTLRYARLRSNASNVVHPNASTARTVAMSNESSTVPVCR